ncbi:hypothetical protein [Actinomadura rupiterrae]|uniref:hypothetical protein n=1 Tax=Actinomadura rupiterrae TaxID=559627 RepID=UPI0020A5B515|nr:hypothetical protein [Actinomadura rupiterrae]MCP2338576.1 hypothetical protein [Actinomadura rupiterrae]
MTQVIAPPVPSAPVAARRRNPLPWWLLLGCAAQVLLRLWLARARTGTAADPDETGYLAAARWLAGGPGADLSHNTFYQAGYPLLLAPLHWFSHDPATVYTGAIAVNALAGAALFPLGYAALRRFEVGCRTALALAFAAALLPATTFFGLFALTDAILPALLLGWLLLLDRFVRTGRAADGAAASLVAAYACFTHSRGEVVLGVHVLALLATRRRAMWAGLLAAAGGYLATSAVNDALRKALYPDGVRDMAGLLHERLLSASGQAWSVSGMLGQVWYLIVGTWGLAGIGLAAAFAALGRRETRLMAGVLLVTTFGVAYASEAALADEHRVGNFAYGRYLACLALVYVLIALAVLFRATARDALRAAAVGGLIAAGTGGVVLVYAGARLRTHQFIGFDFPETMFLTQDRTGLRLGLATFAAFGLLAALLAVRWLGGARTVAVALATVNVAAMVWLAGDGGRVRPASPLPAASERGGVVTDYGVHWMARTKLVVPVWWTRIGWIDARHQGAPRGVCTVVVRRGSSTTALDRTWPHRPAGWLPREGGDGMGRWVAWYDPRCGTS